LPDDNVEVERVARMSWHYVLIGKSLYHRGANNMMMKCISKEEGIKLLKDINGGICGSHSSYHSIVDKAFRHGLYWPTTKDEAVEVVTKCKDCQLLQR
jgi:hypothetical protein